MKVKVLLTAALLTQLVGCTHKEEKAKEILPIKVSTTKVESKKMVKNLNYSGTIEAFQTIPLSFEGTGTIAQVYVEAGDKVQKGQLLAVLDKTDAQNMYKITEAKQKQAQDAYNRLKSVYEKGSLPEVKWIEIQTGLEQANSSLEIAKSNLEKCELRSPVSGIVGRRNIEPGMSALMVTQSPIEIVKIESVYVKIAIPEKEIGKLKKGEEATFSVCALGEEKYTGKISNISPVADKLSRTYEAKILVKNSTLELLPGMVCDVNLSIENTKACMLVPYTCVSMDNENNKYVYVVDTKTNKATKRIITVGQYYGNYLEVTSGLEIDEIVVKSGKEKLTNNCLISL